MASADAAEETGDTASTATTGTVIDSKEAGRVAAFRLLRAKKVLLALAAGEDDEESSDSD